MKRLSEILETSGAGAVPDRDPEITAVSGDSRSLRRGGLFVAVPGRTVDGRAFVADAVARGAAAVAFEAPITLPTDVVGVPVVDARCALAELAAAFHGHPSRSLDVVGVTGTNGKTTTTFLLESIFAVDGSPAGLFGTIRCSSGARVTPASMTTPPSDEIQRLLAETRKAGLRRAVLEISSHALDQDRIWMTELAVAVFTRITRDHLDYHGDRDAYLAAKVRLLSHLRPDAAVVLNADDPSTALIRPRIARSARVLGYSVAGHPDAELTSRVDSMRSEGCRLLIRHGGEVASLRSSLTGLHNVENILAAVTAARALGVDLVTAARGVEALVGVPGRLERITTSGGFEVFVDYAHTPDALERVLTSLAPLAGNRLICVFGCGGDRDRGKRPEMGRIAEERADLVVLTDDNPRGEAPDRIAAQIRVGMTKPAAARYLGDRREAIAWALREAGRGDVVLIAGKGHEGQQVRRGGRIDHDDRAVVRELLEVRRGVATEVS